MTAATLDGIVRFLTTPLEPTIHEILPVYLLALVASITLGTASLPFSATALRVPETPDGLRVFAVDVIAIAPPIEELAFRGTIVSVVTIAAQFGVTVATFDVAVMLWAATIGWAALHGWPRALAILPSGVVYVKLWLAGYAGGLAAIAVHAAHNAMLTAILAAAVYWQLRQRRAARREYPPPDHPTAEAHRRVRVGDADPNSDADYTVYVDDDPMFTDGPPRFER